MLRGLAFSCFCFAKNTKQFFDPLHNISTTNTKDSPIHRRNQDRNMKDCSWDRTIPETGFPYSQDPRKTEKNVDDSLKNSDFLSWHKKQENLNYSSVL